MKVEINDKNRNKNFFQSVENFRRPIDLLNRERKLKKNTILRILLEL